MLTASSDTSSMPGNWLIESGQWEGLSLPKDMLHTQHFPFSSNFLPKKNVFNRQQEHPILYTKNTSMNDHCKSSMGDFSMSTVLIAKFRKGFLHCDHYMEMGKLMIVERTSERSQHPIERQILTSASHTLSAPTTFETFQGMSWPFFYSFRSSFLVSQCSMIICRVFVGVYFLSHLEP